jgi:hypothetical protein
MDHLSAATCSLFALPVALPSNIAPVTSSAGYAPQQKRPDGSQHATGRLVPSVGGRHSEGLATTAVTTTAIGLSPLHRASLRELSQLCWFGFERADRQAFRRLPTIPKHYCVGFVGGDAQDHAAPISPDRLDPTPAVERGFGVCGELYPVSSLYHQSPSVVPSHS